MTFKQQLQVIMNWSKTEQIALFNQISRNIPIGLRMILAREELSDKSKIEAIMWLNEFQHEINKVSLYDNKIISNSRDVSSMANYIKLIATKNDGLLKSELAFCINDAFEKLLRQINKS